MSEARIDSLSNENNTGGPTLSGITTFSGTNYFVPPVGSTIERPQNPQKGALRFNTDIAKLEYFRGDTIGWTEIEASNEELDGSTRAFAAGGHSGPNGPGYSNSIDYYTIDYPSNALDFGDLGNPRGNGVGGCASRTRGFITGGYNSGTQIEYITMATKGTNGDWDNIAQWSEGGCGMGNQTRGFNMGGFIRPAPLAWTRPSNIDCWNTSTTGTAFNFGDLNDDLNYSAAFASTTRGFNIGGTNPAVSNAIQYVTISTTGNGQDFGDLTQGAYVPSGCSNATRGLTFIGMSPDTSTNTNAIEYTTMATQGNAIDFGDTTVDQNSSQAASSPTRASLYSGTGGGVLKWYVVNIATQGNVVEFGDVVNAGSNYGKYGGAGFSNGHGGL